VAHANGRWGEVGHYKGSPCLGTRNRAQNTERMNVWWGGESWQFQEYQLWRRGQTPFWGGIKGSGFGGQCLKQDGLREDALSMKNKGGRKEAKIVLCLRGDSK